VLKHCAALGAALALAPGPAHAATHFTTYPAPPDEPASADYQVYANGQPVFCYTSYRVDADARVPDDPRLKTNEWVASVVVM
jgi:hypothetical protein